MLARAAALIFAFTAVSRVLGFLREAVFAATFGASAELDAFFVAQGPQNIVVTLVSTAVVTSAIPVLAAYVSDGDDGRARATFNAVFTLVLGALIAAAGLMAIFAEPLVRLTAPGFDPEQVELAARLARILLAASALVAATNLISGLLQAHRRFLWPAVVGIPFNVAMIGAALLLAGDLGAVALALGFVIGSAARVAVLAPGPGTRAAGSGGRPTACPLRAGSSASGSRCARSGPRAPGSWTRSARDRASGERTYAASLRPVTETDRREGSAPGGRCAVPPAGARPRSPARRGSPRRAPS